MNHLPTLPFTDPTLCFFVVLMIILLAPIVMGRLRIPHIIGMVLAGVLVGPYGLGLMERDQSFELFGQVGLLYIMFLAGLEMNIHDIKKSRWQLLLFGMATFFVPFAAGWLLGRSVMGYTASASVLLACILSSNTLIAYPIVTRFGLQKHRSVTLSVGASMMALSLALVIVAAMSASYVRPSGVDMWFWLLFVAKLTALCTAEALLLPRLTRWYFRRTADAVSLFIYVLAALFASAALSELCGLEGIFGAFLAGLVLGRFIPGASPLMNRLEFTGNAVFIPYFLIGVGMLIDLRLLFTGWHTVSVVVAMTLVGTAGKAVAAYASALLLRRPALEGHMMFGLTAAHAAGSIAMVMVGMNLLTADGQPIVDSEMLNGVVIMILFTCIISSVTVDRASAAILMKERLGTDKAPGLADDEKLLLPIDHDGDADRLVRLAILMRNRRLGRGLIGLHVVMDDAEGDTRLAAGERLLERATQTAASADVRMQVQSRLATNIANGIKHAFMENRASEIIMGLHRQRDRGDSFWGSYAQDLVAEIPRQVMLCRLSQPLETLRAIHVAVPSRVEFEPGFYRWVERLCRLAAALGCRIAFHGRQDTTELIRQYATARHPQLRADYPVMEHWKELTALESKVNADDLFVVITARKGTISYKATFELLPRELTQCFAHCSLIVVYPDQHGRQQDVMTFTAPRTVSEQSSVWDTLKAWANMGKD